MNPSLTPLSSSAQQSSSVHSSHTIRTTLAMPSPKSSVHAANTICLYPYFCSSPSATVSCSQSLFSFLSLFFSLFFLSPTRTFFSHLVLSFFYLDTDILHTYKSKLSSTAQARGFDLEFCPPKQNPTPGGKQGQENVHERRRVNPHPPRRIPLHNRAEYSCVVFAWW